MAELLKNVFTKEYITDLSKNIKKEYLEFDIEKFINYIFNDKWENLELKERMRLISFAFNEFLHMEYEKQVDILIKVKKELSYNDSMGLQSMIFQDFVEVFGLDDFDNSIKALEEFTINSSSEFAIRQFILKYEDKTILQMKKWAKSKNLHIRRLASEGSRPRLPWAIALPKYKKDPSKVLEIIELLKNDESEYVRKSVANNLNDISKDNPHILIEFIKKNIGKTKELDWICKHASRTLLKAGEKTVLELFGYKADKSFSIESFICSKEVKEGENLNFFFDLKTSKKSLGSIRLEYAIDFQKANGTLSRKVFMISQNQIKTNSKSFKKYQSFKAITTRKYHKGLHKIAIIVNGEEKIIEEFNLI